MTTSRARQILRSVYEQGGFIRVKMEKRRGAVRSGWELRLPTNNDVSADMIITALETLKLPVGSPYTKRRHQIVPVYGLIAVQQFLDVVRPKVKSIIPKLPNRVDLRFKKPR